MSYVRRYLFGGLWTLAGTGVSRISATLVMMLVAREQGAVEFGKIGLIQNSLGTIGTLIGLGLSTTSLRYTASLKNDEVVRLSDLNKFITSIAVIMGFFASVVIYFFSEAFSVAINGDQSFQKLLILSIPYVFFNLLSGLQSGQLIGFSDFRSLAKIQLLDAVMWFLIVFPFSLEIGSAGFCCALSIKLMITWFQGIRFLSKHQISQSGSLESLKNLDNWKIFWQFSIPAMLANVSSAPVSLYGQSVVAKARGHAELGLYFAASQVNFLVTAVMTVFSQVSTSLLAESFDKSNSANFTNKLEKNFKINMYAAIFMGSAFFILKDSIFSLYGAEYAAGSILLTFTVSAAVISVGQMCVVQFYVGSGKMWHSLLCQLVWVTTFLSTLLSGWGQYGAIALARALFIANLATFLVQVTLASFLSENIRVKNFLAPLAVAAAMFYGTANHIIAIVYLSMVYALLILIVGVFTYFIRAKEKQSDAL